MIASEARGGSVEGWTPRGRVRSGASVGATTAGRRAARRAGPEQGRTSGGWQQGGLAATGLQQGHPAATPAPGAARRASAAGTAPHPPTAGTTGRAPSTTNRTPVAGRAPSTTDLTPTGGTAGRAPSTTDRTPTTTRTLSRSAAGRRATARPRPTSWRRSVDRRPRPGHGLLHRLRLAAVVASALVLVVNGTAWGLYRDVTAGITTTDVISGGGDGGPLDILLVGVDSRTDAQGNPLPQEVLQQLHTGGDNPRVLNSDTIILLHVPEDGGAAVAFSIPRDAYVPIPGYRTDKINAAYPAVQALTAERLVGEGVKDRARIDTESAQAGRSALIGAVEQLTGVHVDHFAEVNLLGFYNLTKAIGGVDVCLKGPVDDPLSGAHFPAGPRTVDGGDALAFVRQRHGLPEGDLSRIRRQQVFLAAVADKILAGGTLTDPSKLTGLVQVVQQSVVLDRGWDLLAFALQASGIAAGNLEFLTVPTKGTETNARGSVVKVDPAEVRAFVEQRSAERVEAARRARAAAAAPTPEPPPPLDVEAAHYVVHVHNGSGATGLASRVQDRLAGLGFVRGTVDNTADTPTSVVRHRDSPDAAKAVAAQLGGIDVEQDDAVPSGHLQVVLGADAPTRIPGLPAAGAPAGDSAAPAPAGGTAAPAYPAITAAGVPCVD
jgi:LCP family protein required for cell wall assembly